MNSSHRIVLSERMGELISSSLRLHEYQYPLTVIELLNVGQETFVFLHVGANLYDLLNGTVGLQVLRTHGNLVRVYLELSGNLYFCLLLHLLSLLVSLLLSLAEGGGGKKRKKG